MIHLITRYAILAFTTISLIFLTMVMTGCEDEEPDHSIRVRNNMDVETGSIVIGSITIGVVSSGQTSQYHDIDTGEHLVKVEGETVATITLEGDGEHKWTVTLHQDETVTIDED